MGPKKGTAPRGGTKRGAGAKEAPSAPAPAPAPMAAEEEDEVYHEPIKRIVKPDTQLELTDVQMEEEITRVLTANDPNVATNITKYNYKDKAYKQDPEGPMDHLAFHFTMDGCSLHKESEEAQQQVQLEDSKKMEAERQRKEAAQEAPARSPAAG